MREWDRFCRLVALFLGTGRVKGQPAASALFIGLPGSGKSSAILRFRHVSSALTISDLTAEPYRKRILPVMRDKGYRHILFPDFWKPFQRKDHSVGNLVGLLSAGMSGEFDHIYVGTQDDSFHGVQHGIIGAMPTVIFNRWHTDLAAQGLLDRIGVFNWEFSLQERMRIEQAIADGDNTDLRPYPGDLPSTPVAVQWDRKLAPLLLEWTDSLKRENRNRLLTMLRSLMHSAAMLKATNEGHPGPVTVTRDQLDLLVEYTDFFKTVTV